MTEAPARISEAEEAFDRLRRRVGVFAAPLLGLILALAPLDLPPDAHRLAVVVAVVVVLWVCETIPLAVTALAGPASAAALGVVTPKEAFAPFASPLIMLFVGGFMLARALTVHGVDRRIALGLLAIPFVQRSSYRALVALVTTAFLSSMWISNTATTAMLIPVALGLWHSLREASDPDEKLAGFGTGLCLLLAYGASIGGIATPVGTAPNVIALGAIENATGERLDFLQWMGFGLPVALAMLVALLIYGRIRFAPPQVDPARLRAAVAQQQRGMGAMTSAQRRVLWVFAVTCAGWVAPAVMRMVLGAEHEAVVFARAHLREGVVAILGATLLFILPRGATGKAQGPLLTWPEAVSIDWGTVLLLGGGLSLGQIMFDTGLAAAIGTGVVRVSGPLAESPVGLIAVTSALVIGLTELTSNTATTSMMVPVVVGIATQAGFAAEAPVICVALAASMAFMMPVSTPPNAMAYGSGHVPLRVMMRTGIVLNIVGLLVVLAAGLLLRGG